MTKQEPTSILHSDQWVLRKLYDIQTELQQAGPTRHLVATGHLATMREEWLDEFQYNPLHPNLFKLLDKRNRQLRSDLYKYERIIADRDAALKEQEREWGELSAEYEPRLPIE
jgi:hypothetical protein